MCLSYKKVCQAIDNLLKRQANAMCDKIRYFIEDYKEMVERNIMGSMDDKILGLCLKIYDRHKEAIETIKRAVAEKYYEKIISNILQEIIKENSFTLEICNNKWVRFSKRVADYASLQIAKDDWVESNKILMVEIRIERRNIFAEIIIRQPKDDNAEKQKKELLNLAKEKLRYTKEEKSYAHIHSVPLFDKENEYFESLCKSDSELKETLKKKLKESGIIETYEDFAHKANELLTKG